MESIVNTELLSNPANWIIIFIVLYLVALIMRVIIQSATTNPPISLPGL